MNAKKRLRRAKRKAKANRLERWRGLSQNNLSTFKECPVPFNTPPAGNVYADDVEDRQPWEDAP